MPGGFRNRLRQEPTSGAAAGVRLLSPPGHTGRGGSARSGAFPFPAGAVQLLHGYPPSMRAGGRQGCARGSRAARGLAASSLTFRAGALLRVRPVFLGALLSMLLPLPAAASGVGVELGDADPCLGRALTPAEFRTSLAEPAMFDELWPLFVALRAENCAGVDRWPDLSDSELMRRVFNGSTVRGVGPLPEVPLPGAVWALLAGVGALIALRVRR